MISTAIKKSKMVTFNITEGNFRRGKVTKYFPGDE